MSEGVSAWELFDCQKYDMKRRAITALLLRLPLHGAHCMHFIHNVFLGRRPVAFPSFPFPLGASSTDAWREGERRQATSKMPWQSSNIMLHWLHPPPPHHSPPSFSWSCHARLQCRWGASRLASQSQITSSFQSPPLPSCSPRSAAAKTPLVVARRERAAVLRRRKGHAGMHQTLDKSARHTGLRGCLRGMRG